MSVAHVSSINIIMDFAQFPSPSHICNKCQLSILLKYALHSVLVFYGIEQNTQGRTFVTV